MKIIDENGEKYVRKRLVYSQYLDKVYCFVFIFFKSC